jgi:type II secretory pathway pseudopilin PulG
MSEQEKKQTGKGLLVVSIIAIVVVAILIGVIIFLVVGQNTKKEEKRQVLVTEDNVEEVVQDFIDQAEEKAVGAEEQLNFTVTMYFTWHFKDGSDASYDSYVENVDYNPNDAYFDIVLAEDESQVLYSSPIIPRGGKLDQIKLNRDLDAGTYDTVCIYNLVDDSQSPIDRQVRVALTLVVEE